MFSRIHNGVLVIKTVRVRWQRDLSKPTEISRDPRQGGLQRLFIFSIFYKDMVAMVSDMSYGVMIGSHTYNVFCYADDILLSVTPICRLYHKSRVGL